MHRTSFVPCRIGWWSLLLALTLHFSIHAASAQAPAKPVQIVDLNVGAARACQMVTKADLKRVENPNSKIVRVERSGDKTNEVLLIAEHPGRSLITFIDTKDRAEVHEVVVAEVLQDGKPIKLSLEKGDSKVITLPEAPIGNPDINRGGIIELKRAAADATGKTWTIKALSGGSTRVVFFGKNQAVIATYDVEVPLGDRVGQLKDLIAKLAPTASVNIVATKIQRERDGKVIFDEAVILTGIVTNAIDATTIVDAARRLFPPSELGQAAQPVGGGVAQTSILQENVVNQLRIGGVHQIELQVVVAVVNRSELRNMSFSWLHASNNWFISSLIGGPGTLGSGLVFPPTAMTLNSTGANVPFGVLNANGGTIGFLQALRTEGLTKILAEPRVVTLSGRPGHIVAGGETPIILAGTAGSVPSVTYKQFGTVVNFLPVVMENGKIQLEVRPEVSEIDNAAGINVGGVFAPGFRTRTAQVTVQIEDGQTLAIGGLIQNTVTATVGRIPVLGDLPFVGVAFTSKQLREEEQELLIMVTPRLVHPVDCCKIPKYLPGRETRSPDDFEFFLEGIMEAPRGQRNTVFHPHLYKSAFHGAPNAGQIPCGDGSCYGRTGCANGQCGPTHLHQVSAPTTLTPSLVAQPLPSFPEIQAQPASKSRIIVEPEMPSIIPPVRDTTPPGLGPVTPTIPLPPARQQDPRPVLPPLTPAGR